MPENALSPTDFKFTEDGELVVRAEQLRAALANARVEPARGSTSAEQPNSQGIESSRVTMDDVL